MTTTAVAIVNYNTRDHLQKCLETVLPQWPAEIVVVDNGSSDGSVEMVRELFPDVRLIQAENRGYGAAANRAFAASSAPYVLLLNTDTLLRPGALEALADYLDDNPRAGVVGPRLLNPDGSLQPSSFAFPYPLSKLARWLPMASRRYLPNWSHDLPRVVPYVLGAAMGLRRSAVEEIGGFDERFFMYFEEADLSLRLVRRGWETHFTPSAIVVHEGGASTRQLSGFMLLELYRSMARYYELHHGWPVRTAALTVKWVELLARLVFAAIRWPLSEDRAALAGELAAVRIVLAARWGSRYKSPLTLGLRKHAAREEDVDRLPRLAPRVPRPGHE